MHRDPDIATLYKDLTVWNREIGHTLDAFTKYIALFSGLEVKAAFGDYTEAELQLSVWAAADIAKKLEMARDANVSLSLAMMCIPGITIVGHDLSVYLICPLEDQLSRTGDVHVLGPDADRFGRLSTSSVPGIFRILRFYKNLLCYGMDEGTTGYWGQYKLVLSALANSSPNQDE